MKDGRWWKCVLLAGAFYGILFAVSDSQDIIIEPADDENVCYLPEQFTESPTKYFVCKILALTVI